MPDLGVLTFPTIQEIIPSFRKPKKPLFHLPATSRPGQNTIFDPRYPPYKGIKSPHSQPRDHYYLSLNGKPHSSGILMPIARYYSVGSPPNGYLENPGTHESGASCSDEGHPWSSKLLPKLFNPGNSPILGGYLQLVSLTCPGPTQSIPGNLGPKSPLLRPGHSNWSQGLRPSQIPLFFTRSPFQASRPLPAGQAKPKSRFPVVL